MALRCCLNHAQCNGLSYKPAAGIHLLTALYKHGSRLAGNKTVVYISFLRQQNTIGGNDLHIANTNNIVTFQRIDNDRLPSHCHTACI